MASVAHTWKLALLRQRQQNDVVGPNTRFTAHKSFVLAPNSVRLNKKWRSYSQTKRSGFGVPRAAAEVVDDRVVEKEEKSKEEGRVLRVGLVCGGPSAERGISLNSARSVLDNIQVRHRHVIYVRMFVYAEAEKSNNGSCSIHICRGVDMPFGYREIKWEKKGKGTCCVSFYSY